MKRSLGAELRWLRDKLPKSTRAYLNGDERHPGGAWSTLLAIAQSCRNAGMDLHDFRGLVLESEFVDSTSLLSNKSKRDAQIPRAWNWIDDRDEDPADANGIRALIASLTNEVRAHQWPGRTGGTDRAVALSVLDRCHELGTYSPVLSSRHLAEKLGIGHATAARSLNRLTELGLLSGRAITDQGNYRYQVRLRWRSRTKGQAETSSSLPVTCISLSVQEGSVPAHDAFVTRALGPTSGRMWFSFSGPTTAREAASRVGVSARTARRCLDSLVSAGLATKDEGRPARFTMQEASAERLDEIAAEYGALGWLDQQRERHENQRTANDYLASRRSN